jgi:hypothetical protein
MYISPVTILALVTVLCLGITIGGFAMLRLVFRLVPQAQAPAPPEEEDAATITYSMPVTQTPGCGPEDSQVMEYDDSAEIAGMEDWFRDVRGMDDTMEIRGMEEALTEQTRMLSPGRGQDRPAPASLPEPVEEPFDPVEDFLQVLQLQVYGDVKELTR